MTYLIITFIIMAVLGVFIFLHRLSQKQGEKKRQEIKTKRLIARTEEIWETIEDTSAYINSPDVFDALLAYYRSQISQIVSTSDTSDVHQHTAKTEAFKGKLNSIEIKHELTSSAEVNQVKRNFSQASKLLRAAYNKKMISGQAFNEMRNTLRKKILDLEVDIHVKLGENAGEKGNPAVAANHYKYAKKLLIESDLKYEGKNDMVRDITNKTQILFGNAVSDQLTKGMKDEGDTHDEFGIPKDLDSMTGNRKHF